MGWGFRKSINLGPLRLNLSKSGVGYSVGGRGLRIGRDARGRNYTSASIPGTGLYNRTYNKGGRPSAPASAAPRYSLPVLPASASPRPARLASWAGKGLAYGVAAVLLYALLSFLLHTV